MSQSRVLDTFIVVNGPEDGAEFTVSRSPVEVGSDARQHLVIRLDNDVALKHGLFVAEAGGYRVRSTGSGPVYVDGKRAGVVRSRHAKDGSTVQLGHTMMVLECAPDGLASRSRGVGSAGDFFWAGRLIVTEGWRGLTALWRVVWDLLRSFYSSWFVIGIIVAVLYFTVPAVKQWVDFIIRWVVHQLQSLN